MKINTRVPAFSVIEAVVSMVVTAIVMGITFILFSILSERMFDFERQNEGISDLNRLSYLLNKDIFESEFMYPFDGGLNFTSPEGRQISYLINESYLIRQQAQYRDTFKTAVMDIYIDTIATTNEKTVFQRIRLDVAVNEQVSELSFFKKVYSSELLKNVDYEH